jgi:hypothetical protein
MSAAEGQPHYFNENDEGFKSKMKAKRDQPNDELSDNTKRPCDTINVRNNNNESNIHNNTQSSGSIPDRATIASYGLEDTVDSLTLGMSTWSLTDMAQRREQAFALAGGKAAEVEQTKLRAKQLKRMLLNGTK